MGTATNTNRLTYFNVLIQSGNGYLYAYLQDSNNLLALTGEQRYRLTQAIDTFKAIYSTYEDIDIEDGLFKFGEKTLQFLGMSGQYTNPKGTGHGLYIRTESYPVNLTD